MSFATVPLQASTLPLGTTLEIDFNTLITGGITYFDPDTDSGKSVFKSGTAFFDKIDENDYLGVNTLIADGITSPNLGAYMEVTYKTPNDLSTIAANGDQLLDIEIRANEVKFDVNKDGSYDEGSGDFTDYWRIVGWQDNTSYLLTFNSLAAPGYVEITSGVWLDIAILPSASSMAISMVFEDVNLDNIPQSIDANLLGGALGGTVPGKWYKSGIRATVVPEPATMALFGLGLLGLAGISRRKES